MKWPQDCLQQSVLEKKGRLYWRLTRLSEAPRPIPSRKSESSSLLVFHSPAQNRIFAHLVPLSPKPDFAHLSIVLPKIGVLLLFKPLPEIARQHFVWVLFEFLRIFHPLTKIAKHYFVWVLFEVFAFLSPSD